MAHDVFISFIGHSAHDRAVAEAARDAIERAGHLCRMAPGEAGEAGGGRLFLLILSAAGADAPEALRECQAAAHAGLPIILFRTENVEPSAALAELLGAAHWLDAMPPPLEPHLDYLTAIVGRLLDGGQPMPIRPLTAPPRPMPAARPPSRAWLPIAITGALGVAAIAAVAWYVAR